MLNHDTTIVVTHRKIAKADGQTLLDIDHNARNVRRQPPGSSIGERTGGMYGWWAGGKRYTHTHAPHLPTAHRTFPRTARLPRWHVPAHLTANAGAPLPGVGDGYKQKTNSDARRHSHHRGKTSPRRTPRRRSTFPISPRTGAAPHCATSRTCEERLALALYLLLHRRAHTLRAHALRAPRLYTLHSTCCSLSSYYA